MSSFASRLQRILSAQLPVYIVAAVAVGFMAFSFYKSEDTNPDPQVKQETVQQASIAPLSKKRLESSTDLTRPVLYMNSESEESDMSQLKVSVKDVINKHIRSGAIKGASVYIRKMDKEESIRINDDQYYDPGSMMKVVIMMAHLKEAMKDNSYLSEKMMFEGRNPTMYTEAGAPIRLEVGKNYSRRELIESMIIHSDNDAAFMLLCDLPTGRIEKIYTDLNIPNRKLGKSAISLSPSEYSKLFTVLYNSSYVNRTDSEWGLSLLCRSDFNKGLTRSIPNHFPVAHKYGVAQFSDITFFGETGLFYSPKGPYLLVVFTQGKSQETQANLISEISIVVYGKLGSNI